MRNRGDIKMFKKIAGSGLDICRGINFDINTNRLSVLLETTTYEFRPGATGFGVLTDSVLLVFNSHGSFIKGK